MVKWIVLKLTDYETFFCECEADSLNDLTDQLHARFTYGYEHDREPNFYLNDDENIFYGGTNEVLVVQGELIDITSALHEKLKAEYNKYKKHEELSEEQREYKEYERLKKKFESR